MDQLDQMIVAHLLRDGRAPYATLAREIGLSLPATKRRVDRLQARGVIRGFTAQVDPEGLGWTLQASVQLFTSGTVAYQRMQRDLELIPEVIEAVTVTGGADTIVRVVAADSAHLERVIGRLRSIDYVRQTDSTMVLSTVLHRSAPEPSPEKGLAARMTTGSTRTDER